MHKFLLGLTCLLVSACSFFQTTHFVEKEGKGLYTIQIPSNLRAAKLNQDASLQYQNFKRDFCIIVREDSWELLKNKQPDFKLEDFFDVSIEKILEGMEGGRGKVPVIDSILLNGAPCFRARIEGNFRGDAVSFNLAVVQGKTHLFQILNWGLQDMYEDQEESIEHIIQSFQLTQLPEDSVFWLTKAE